jgi:hypothetical protein
LDEAMMNLSSTHDPRAQDLAESRSSRAVRPACSNLCEVGAECERWPCCAGEMLKRSNLAANLSVAQSEDI